MEYKGDGARIRLAIPQVENSIFPVCYSHPKRRMIDEPRKEFVEYHPDRQLPIRKLMVIHFTNEDWGARKITRPR